MTLNLAIPLLRMYATDIFACGKKYILQIYLLMGK